MLINAVLVCEGFFERMVYNKDSKNYNTGISVYLNLSLIFCAFCLVFTGR